MTTSAEAWELTDGTIVHTAGGACTVAGTSPLAVALRADLGRDPVILVGFGEHQNPLELDDPDRVVAWLAERAYEHGAQIRSGYQPPARPPPPPGAVY